MKSFPHNHVAGFWFLLFSGSYLFGCYFRWETPTERGFISVLCCSLLLYMGHYCILWEPSRGTNVVAED